MQLIIYNISKWTTHYHFDKNVLFAEAFFSASSNRRAARRVMLRCDDIVQNEGNQLTWKVNIFKMSNLVVHTMHTYDSDNVYFVLMAICIGKRCKSISFHMHFSLSLSALSTSPQYIAYDGTNIFRGKNGVKNLVATNPSSYSMIHNIVIIHIRYDFNSFQVNTRMHISVYVCVYAVCSISLNEVTYQTIKNQTELCRLFSME